MEKAQAFTTFKLLIGAVFAAMLLVYAYYVMYSPSTPFSSVQMLSELVAQSKSAPKICFERSISFNKGESINWGSIASEIYVYSDYPGIVACSFEKCDVRDSSELPVTAITNTAITEVRIGKSC